jgi:hypothetical protein
MFSRGGGAKVRRRTTTTWLLLTCVCSRNSRGRLCRRGARGIKRFVWNSLCAVLRSCGLLVGGFGIVVISRFSGLVTSDESSEQHLSGACGRAIESLSISPLYSVLAFWDCGAEIGVVAKHTCRAISEHYEFVSQILRRAL